MTMELVNCLSVSLFIIFHVRFANPAKALHAQDRIIGNDILTNLKLDKQLKDWNSTSTSPSRTMTRTTNSIIVENKRSHNINNDGRKIIEKLDSPVQPTIYKSMYSYSSRRTHHELSNTDFLDRRESPLSALWALLHQKRLEVSEDDVANDGAIRPSIVSKMVNGTALIIASCDVSILHAAMSSNNTVLSVFLDHSSSQECLRRIHKKNLANVYIAHMDVNEIMDKILLSRNVRFDFIFIMEYERLTMSLLPQEFEDISQSLLSLSRSFVFILGLQDEKILNIFKSSWEKPKDLLHNVCDRFITGSCLGEILDGSEQFWVPLLVSFKRNKSKEVGGCEDNGLPLQILLSHNLTSDCRRKLFTSLLVSDPAISVNEGLFIQGHVITKSLCHSRESQSMTSRQFFNSYSNSEDESQNKLHTYATSETIRNSFDIVDGRPVEEESILTRGYQELGQGELKSSPPTSTLKEKAVESGSIKPPLTDREKINTSDSDAKKTHYSSDNPDSNVGNNFQTTRVSRKDKRNSVFMETILKPADKPGSKSTPFPSLGLKRVLTGDSKRSQEKNVPPVGTLRKAFQEENKYKSVMKALTPHFEGMFKSGKSLSGLISGGCHLSMVSAKLSMKHPDVNLITLDTDKRRDCSKTFGSILVSAEISNNFMIREELSPAVLYQISHTPQLFDFQIIGPEIFSWMPQTGQAFSDFIARTLSMSRVTFLEVPTWATMRTAAQLFRKMYTASENYDSFQDFLRASISTTSSKLFKVEEISERLPGVTDGMQLWRVEMQTFQRKVFPSCNSGQSSPEMMLYERPTPTLVAGGRKMIQQEWRWKGLNLKALLSFDLKNEQRRKLFESYLRVPLYEDMCPSRLFWRNGRVNHVDQTPTLKEDREQVQTLTQFINSQFHQRIFSFIDYNSLDKWIGTTLARRHPRSTFILTENSAAAAERKSLKMKKSGLNNTVVLDLPVTRDFSHHLLKSPDIVRYQFIDFVKLLATFNREASKDTFKTMVGELLSSGLTNFIIVPTSEILSLATSTIFPGVFDSRVHLISNSISIFEDVERTLLQQTADMGHRKIRVHSTLHSSFPLSSSTKGARAPWKVNTVRILRLQQKVDHHFQFELDQHERKYIQHVERKGPSRQPEVFLIREEDNYRINYGNVSAISLIALLRMGILPSDREKFYSLFLQLPLHEDMAPWNIVFQGGQLAYIDQDTRDKTFDKIIPAAYQVMSVLINYERTVKDFEHCGDRASTQYNFGQISSCVSSQFQGPCPDSRYPVPCGDQSCQPTYIHCLRALQSRMKHQHGTSWQGSGRGSKVSQSDQTKGWEFDDADNS